MVKILRLLPSQLALFFCFLLKEIATVPPPIHRYLPMMRQPEKMDKLVPINQIPRNGECSEGTLPTIRGSTPELFGKLSQMRKSASSATDIVTSNAAGATVAMPADGGRSRSNTSISSPQRVKKHNSQNNSAGYQTPRIINLNLNYGCIPKRYSLFRSRSTGEQKKKSGTLTQSGSFRETRSFSANCFTPPALSNATIGVENDLKQQHRERSRNREREQHRNREEEKGIEEIKQHRNREEKDQEKANKKKGKSKEKEQKGKEVENQQSSREEKGKGREQQRNREQKGKEEENQQKNREEKDKEGESQKRNSEEKGTVKARQHSIREEEGKEREQQRKEEGLEERPKDLMQKIETSKRSEEDELKRAKKPAGVVDRLISQWKATAKKMGESLSLAGKKEPQQQESLLGIPSFENIEQQQTILDIPGEQKQQQSIPELQGFRFPSPDFPAIMEASPNLQGWQSSNKSRIRRKNDKGIQSRTEE